MKVLGVQDHCDLALAAPASPGSIEKMTHTMEFLRSQADFASGLPPSPTAQGSRLTWAPRSGRPAVPSHYNRQISNCSGSHQNGLNSSTDGPLLANCEQAESYIPETPSSPASPMRVLRSVRTIRGSPGKVKAANGENNTSNVEGTSLESRSTTPSAFRRFYSRSQSETSMSSDHSNPGTV